MTAEGILHDLFLLALFTKKHPDHPDTLLVPQLLRDAERYLRGELKSPGVHAKNFFLGYQRSPGVHICVDKPGSRCPICASQGNVVVRDKMARYPAPRLLDDDTVQGFS
jgi:hypothetical protein